MNDSESNMHDQYIVSRMNKNEVTIAIEWARKEGWNPGLHDAQCFYQTDSNGFFVGKLDGKIVAMGSAVIYDEQFAFCGFYMVDPIHRGKGYGLALTKERLAYIGSRNAGIDGVVHMLEKYTRIGYKLAYHNARYQGENLHPIIKKNGAITLLSHINFEQLCTYDRQYFPAHRDSFLSCWINQVGGNSLGYIEQNQLKGYGVIRPCYQGFKIGPLFAEDPKIANELFTHLIHYACGEPIYLDIPECNPYAVDLVSRYHLDKVFETARMYLKAPPNINMEHVYGITSFELG